MVFLKKQFYFQFTKWWRIKKLNHFFFKFHVNMGLWWCETRFFKRNHQLPSNTTKFIFCKKFIFCNFTHIYDNLIWWKLIFCANWFLVIFPLFTTKFTIFYHLCILTSQLKNPVILWVFYIFLLYFKNLRCILVSNWFLVIFPWINSKFTIFSYPHILNFWP